jgi:biopolymer transport protein ExbD
MAYRPSKRMKHGHDEAHTNIAPLMNLMVILIPLLLTSAEFIKLGVIELNLPPASAGGYDERSDAMGQEFQNKLDLAVTITRRGFYISSSLAVLSGDVQGEPTIPLGRYIDVSVTSNGQWVNMPADSLAHDYEALSNKLLEIKNAAQGSFSDLEQIVILAESEIKYQTIISTMDASRSIVIDGEERVLFPAVSLSAGVF